MVKYKLFIWKSFEDTLHHSQIPFFTRYKKKNLIPYDFSPDCSTDGSIEVRGVPNEYTVSVISTPCTIYLTAPGEYNIPNGCKVFRSAFLIKNFLKYWIKVINNYLQVIWVYHCKIRYGSLSDKNIDWKIYTCKWRQFN